MSDLTGVSRGPGERNIPAGSLNWSTALETLRTLTTTANGSNVEDACATLERVLSENRAAIATLEQRLAAEVAGAQTLQSISTRLISEATQESLLEQLLDAALELMGADSASLQMLEPDQKSLTLIGWRNMHPESVAFWRHVSIGSSTSCSHALRDHRRVVIPDIEACDFMAGTEDLRQSRRSGVRSVQSTPLHSRSGALLGMISTHWSRPHTPTDADFRLFDVLARQAADLIERTRAEAAVRESEEWFRLMANSAPVTIWMTGADKGCTYVNQAWLDFTGRPVDAALGRGWTEGIHPEDVERSWETYAEAFDRREPFQMEYRARRQDGEFRWVIDTGVPRYKADGSFAGYIGSAMDITERRLAQEALSTVSQRLIDAQEEERSRLARELHDDISQRLGLLSLRLSELAFASLQPDKGIEPLMSITREEVTNLVKDVHDLSHRLHPPRLELLGLAAAADALCEEFSNQRTMDVRFQTENVPKRLPSRVSLCLYRILQEALQNAAKHSGASHVDVSLMARADTIELTVRDSGHGFDLSAAARTRGLGLSSMKERIKSVQGQLVVESELQRGTVIRARVPYRSLS